MSTEIDDLREEIKDLERERDGLLDETGALESDMHNYISRANRAEDAADAMIEILKRIEPTISDQLLRFDVRKAIDEAKSAMEEDR